MYTEISFPSLGIVLDPPKYLQIDPLMIYYYGVIIACGLILAVLYGCKRSREFGIKEDDVLDGVLWVTPFAIVCARIYYVAFSWADYASNPISVLYIWEGGIAIYGGVIGAIIGMAVMSKIKKVKFATVLDIILMVFLLGQSIGRWGNFMNREAFGAATDSFFRMGLFNTVTNQWEYYHPTFLYESLWNLVGVILLHLYVSKGKRKYDGEVFTLYVIWYGIGRCMIEGLRADSLYIGSTGIRVSQLLAAVSCFAAVAMLLYFGFFKQPDPKKMQVHLMQSKEAQQKNPDDAQ